MLNISNISNIIDSLQMFKTNIEFVIQENDDLKEKNKIFNDLLEENHNLKKKVEELEEYNKSFTTVSLIVAAKNENTRLLNELTLLYKRLKYYEKQESQKDCKICNTNNSTDLNEKKNNKSSTNKDYHSSTDKTNKDKYQELSKEEISEEEEEEDIKEEDVSEEEEICEEEDVSEEAIDGKIYYVSDTDLIYERIWNNNDWDIGDMIGTLNRQTNTIYKINV